MSTNSDRHHVQLEIERAIGCPNPIELRNFGSSFESFTIGHQNLGTFANTLKQDSSAFLRKGVLSFLQAMSGLESGQQSWAIIKLYYCIFFLLRAELGMKGIAVVRCKTVYTLHIEVNQSPIKRSGEKYKGDHKAAISLFTDLFDGTDIILSQTIEGQNPYKWMCEKREWINYRRRDFLDLDEFELINSEISDVTEWVSKFCLDTIPIYCFDPDFAMLALPIKRLQISLRQFTSGFTIFDQCFSEHAKKNIPNTLNEVFSRFARMN